MLVAKFLQDAFTQEIGIVLTSLGLTGPLQQAHAALSQNAR
jgi:hypothetical protein